LAFVRERWKDIYPELLLRTLLIGYLYGITSECKLGIEPFYSSCSKKSSPLPRDRAV
jgi:hypothetical protein